MTILLKTIQIFSLTTDIFSRMVFSRSDTDGTGYDTYSESSIFWKKILTISIGMSVICGIGFSVFLIHQIVDNQYAISVLTKEIKKEENANQLLLARYSEIRSLSFLTEEKLTQFGFQSVDAPRYIGADAILQANAIIR